MGEIHAMKRITQSSSRKAVGTQRQLPGHSTEVIQRAILLCADLFHEEMTEAKATFWKELLDSYPAPAIEWAFDNWNRNGEFFPKPKDITRLIEAYRESNEAAFRTCGQCDSGWIIVNPEAKRSEQKARRCSCVQR